jgi:hypothetical protein
VLVDCGDPPDPDQAGFAVTVYLVQVCKEHDPGSSTVDELLIDCEEDRTFRAVLVGMFREGPTRE